MASDAIPPGTTVHHFHRRIEEHRIPGMPLGRQIEFDRASADYAIQPMHTVQIRDVWWPRRAPIFDQDKPFTYKGKRYPGGGSCTGNATAGTKGTDSAGRVGDKTMRERNAIDVYHLATTLDPFPGEFPPDDTGSSTLAALKAAKALGWASAYVHAFSFKGVQSGLQAGAMMTGTNWYDSFDQPDSNGRVTISPNAAVRGGHEYDIVGLHLEPMLLECVNSWGPGWGKKGRFFVPFADYERLLHEHGDAGQPVWATA